MGRSSALFVAGVCAVACSGANGPTATSVPPGSVPSRGGESSPAASPAHCDGSRALTVHFYDVGQALAALVDLPDGRHVLVDTGDSPLRQGCDACAAEDRHLLDALRADLKDDPIALLWITHQHSDHIGGAPEILRAFRVATYVDNGRDVERSEVRAAHRAAEARGASIQIVDPEHRAAPIARSAEYTIAPILPRAWPPSCSHDPNECSILLRIDFCASSLLFTGDAEHDEEALVDPGGPVTLLQVAHHGSETSTTSGFLARARPAYAVISSGKPGDGLNADYCHPRANVVERLSRAMPDAGGGTRGLRAFAGARCAGARSTDWAAVPASERIWATGRDGDVVLTTNGDGTFHRRLP